MTVAILTTQITPDILQSIVPWHENYCYAKAIDFQLSENGLIQDPDGNNRFLNPSSNIEVLQIANVSKGQRLLLNHDVMKNGTYCNLICRVSKITTQNDSVRLGTNFQKALEHSVISQKSKLSFCYSLNLVLIWGH